MRSARNGDRWGPVASGVGVRWGVVGSGGERWGPVGSSGDRWGAVGTGGEQWGVVRAGVRKQWGPVGSGGERWGAVVLVSTNTRPITGLHLVKQSYTTRLSPAPTHTTVRSHAATQTHAERTPCTPNARAKRRAQTCTTLQMSWYKLPFVAQLQNMVSRSVSWCHGLCQTGFRVSDRIWTVASSLRRPKTFRKCVCVCCVLCVVVCVVCCCVCCWVPRISAECEQHYHTRRAPVRPYLAQWHASHLPMRAR